MTRALELRGPALAGLLWLAVATCAPAQDAPGPAPAYREAQFPAIGYVTAALPLPGAGRNVGGCSATLIAPDLVLTAAHCAGGHDMHVTFGWSDTVPLWRAPVAETRVHSSYVPDVRSLEALPGDLALLRLARPVPSEAVRPIPLTALPYDPEIRFAAYGYSRGDPMLLRGAEDCPGARIRPGVVGFACTVASGFSGAPLMVETEEGWRVAGVIVAHLPGRTEGLRSFAAIPDSGFLAAE